MTGPESRELGVLAANLANLTQKFEEHRKETTDNRASVQSELKEIKKSLQVVLDNMNGWRGGWKVMATIAAIASFITTVFLQLFHK